MAYAAMNLQVGEPSASVEPVKQRISEVSLSLKNLSYAISGMVGGEEPLDPENMAHALFAVHRQITSLSKDLDELAGICESCSALKSPVEVFPAQARCDDSEKEKGAVAPSVSISPLRR